MAGVLKTGRRHVGRTAGAVASAVDASRLVGVHDRLVRPSPTGHSSRGRLLPASRFNDRVDPLGRCSVGTRGSHLKLTASLGFAGTSTAALPLSGFGVLSASRVFSDAIPAHASGTGDPWLSA